ncbi:uncharacterized protein LOC125496284 [Beta vulgaris subsp. vulgaris]|uniref:uncharacterized protein LOC125496284 n=1 Tax=Beta vulgaris subsp. vulgaris TaxID=3555 RepID=UPI002037578E|nr:uncharacterized protein LOC125496284 [Beta vulgaris subsp. vulgaris]
MAEEEVEVIKSAPYKKQKVSELTQSTQAQSVDEILKEIKWADWESDEDVPNARSMKFFTCKLDPLDTTHAFPIIYDLQELEQRDVGLGLFSQFVFESYNKHALEFYDHPGIRSAGFYHREGEYIDAFHRAPAEHAFQWYRDMYPHGSNVRLKEVTKITCRPDCHIRHYVTFTVVDVDTNEETTLQAHLFEYGLPRDWLLGMLRDVSRGRVLAITRLKQASSGEAASELSYLLEILGKEVLVTTST